MTSPLLHKVESKLEKKNRDRDKVKVLRAFYIDQIFYFLHHKKCVQISFCDFNLIYVFYMKNYEKNSGIFVAYCIIETISGHFSGVDPNFSHEYRYIVNN